MRVVAVTMVRDEADILGETIANLWAQGVDEILVADNLSVDGSGDLAADLGCKVLMDSERGYYQSAKMSALAEQAADEGDWVIPFDADEIWWSTLGPLAEVLRESDHRCEGKQPYVMVPREPWTTLADIRWRLPQPETNYKVAFRWFPGARIEMGNHGVTDLNPMFGRVEVKHYQWRSLEQVRRKVRNGLQAFNASSLPASFGRHWRDLAAMTADEQEAWWEAYISQPLIECP